MDAFVVAAALHVETLSLRHIGDALTEDLVNCCEHLTKNMIVSETQRYIESGQFLMLLYFIVAKYTLADVAGIVVSPGVKC